MGKKPLVRVAAMDQRDFQMPVVANDARQRRSHRLTRAFQQLHVEIGAHDQRTGEAGQRVFGACMQQNAVERAGFKPEGARDVDQLSQSHPRTPVC